MKKKILIAGASSAMASYLIQQEGHDYILLSTRDVSDKGFPYYSVNSYVKSELPDIDDTLDGIVYFPGTIQLRPFHSISENDFMRDLEINTLGAVYTVQKYLPNLKRSGSASVVFVSTVAASVGLPYHSSISLSKGALEGFAKALAAELAPKIRVNVVAPSLTDTPLAKQLLSTAERSESSAARHPLKRVGRVDDIAYAIEFLISDKSSWMTGQIMAIDGGISSIRL